jgi:hypothetical protein
MGFWQLTRKPNTLDVGFGRAEVDVAASQTDSAIVAAVAGHIIRVHAFILLCGATATVVTFKSKPAGGGSDISPDFQLGANLPLEPGWNPVGWFQTVVSEGLSIDTGAGSTTSIVAAYSTILPE